MATVCLFEHGVRHVGVALGCGDGCVTQEMLNNADVGTNIEHGCREAVAEGVGCDGGANRASDEFPLCGALGHGEELRAVAFKLADHGEGGGVTHDEAWFTTFSVDGEFLLDLTGSEGECFGNAESSDVKKADKGVHFVVGGGGEECGELFFGGEDEFFVRLAVFEA